MEYSNGRVSYLQFGEIANLEQGISIHQSTNNLRLLSDNIVGNYIVKMHGNLEA